MITHSASPASHGWYEEKNHLDIHVTAGLTKEDNAIVSVGRILKWFGATSTVLLSAAALAPDTFGIPVNLQPWIFLTAIFWVIAFCAGMFDL
jgi:hypothetical protein